jgi:hypothetical protein
MTQEHPITPPPELVAKLWREASAGRDDAPIGEIFKHGVYLAYRAGADQELEACCEWLDNEIGASDPNDLYAERRPNPPTLKEQALEVFDKLEHLFDGYGDDGEIIRRALEALPND